jgi:hypothetical protein
MFYMEQGIFSESKKWLQVSWRGFKRKTKTLEETERSLMKGKFGLVNAIFQTILILKLENGGLDYLKI